MRSLYDAFMRVILLMLGLNLFAMGQTCMECHVQEAEKWKDSHHRHAMHVISPEVVFGDFSGKQVKEGLYEATFSSGNGQYWAELEGKDGKRVNVKVSHTFGWEPIQQYLVEMEESNADGLGKTQVLPWAWDKQKKRWIHLFIDEKPKPGEPLHWTGWGQNWNHMCADCHTTGYRKNFDQKTLRFSSTFEHDNVHCLACHEPHGKREAKAGQTHKGVTSLDFDRQKQRNEINSCGPCHSFRSQLTPGKTPKESFENHYRLMGLSEESYHHDGQIKGEVYVLGSFLQSKMYRAGVRCSHCHDPHSLKLRAPQREVCFQCHDQSKYASPTHHRHREGGSGSNCLDCHMPESVYMRVDPRRDHSFKSPRPDLSSSLGTPNACTGCHLQEERKHQFRDYQKWLAADASKHPEWKEAISSLDKEMASAMKKWGMSMNSPGLVELIVRAREGELVPALEKMVLNEVDYGPITRSTVASLLTEPKAETVRALASSDDAMVREASLQHEELSFILEKLKDPIRSVRLTALRHVLERTRSWTVERRRSILSETLKEDLSLELEANADQAGAHLFFGQVHESIGERAAAIGAYEKGTEVQPEWLGPRQALANLLPPGPRANRLRKEEVEILKENLKVAPQRYDFLYTKGLLYYQLGQIELCIDSMRTFLGSVPDHYNASAFVIQLEMRRGKKTKALEEVKRALEYHPRDPWLRSLIRSPLPR